MSKYTLGISCYYHDSAVALLSEGKVVAAVQEERVSRIKNDASFPSQSLRLIIERWNIDPNEIEVVNYYEKPFLTFERILETYHAFSPIGFLSYLKILPLWFKDKVFIKNKIRKELKKLGISPVKFQFPSHHHSHMAAAFYPSPFDSAAILTLDGVGEWETLSFGVGEGINITQWGKINYPHSLGLFYSSFTAYCGFKVNNGEYKLMGLAPYAKILEDQVSHYKQLILKNLIDIKEDGSFRLNLEYFDFPVGFQMFDQEKWEKLFQIPPRNEFDPLEKEYASLALACQQVTEEILIKLAQYIQRETGQKNLCLGGGVALNCVANGILEQLNIFDNIWIQPASGDAGSALGAALVSQYQFLQEKQTNTMQGCSLGPEFKDQEILLALDHFAHNFEFKYLETEELLIKNSVKDLKEQKILGWFQGRMEFGPRALGFRSILADPRGQDVQKVVNQRIKKREGFRPFAPAITEEDFLAYFEAKKGNPYMLMVHPLKKEWFIKQREMETPESEFPVFIAEQLYSVQSLFPAITHVDGSARAQMVVKEDNRLFHSLLKSFKKETDCPMLLNTSFNVKDEPIVSTPHDALECFQSTELDVLYLGQYRVTRISK
ncbi:MAG: hypothetical protein NXH75_07780 [Halobacteriovoraceae bacterium]|nr:hypothetical protein [Halobacteriovoraceae bacterium]